MKVLNGGNRSDPRVASSFYDPLDRSTLAAVTVRKAVPMPSSASRLAITGIAGVLLAASAVVPAAAATPATVATVSAVPSLAAKKTATTSAKERKRVDSVKTPKLGWYKCYDT